MSRVAYVNGRYVPHNRASVHIEDRGYQFADGVYEVVAIHDGRLVDEKGHLDRLERSLKELRIAAPLSRGSLEVVIREVMRRNLLREGIIYIQATRGVAQRDHPFPAASTKPALVITAARKSGPNPALFDNGVTAITHPDIRWKRRDIKSVSLLPNILAKQAAREAGAYEAWLIDDEGHVTEGSSSNAWIVTPDGELVTRPLGPEILAGITRGVLGQLAARNGLKFVERAFTEEEAKHAREAFVTSATSYVTPIVQIDDAVIGNGKPGSVARQMFDLYCAHMKGEGASAA